jgi:hypothetical protein
MYYFKIPLDGFKKSHEIRKFEAKRASQFTVEKFEKYPRIFGYIYRECRD